MRIDSNAQSESVGTLKEEEEEEDITTTPLQLKP